MLGVQMLPTNCKNSVDLEIRDVPTSKLHYSILIQVAKKTENALFGNNSRCFQDCDRDTDQF